MNKVMDINLGGLFFHIDEVAYKVLKKYLEAISKSLVDAPEVKGEIISDIEVRISELLLEKIADKRQVISERDINDVMDIMGQPEDYGSTGYSEDENGEKTRRFKNKKLFRDGEERFFGGVSSGISHYFNIDPIWIRLAFIILAFTGFGIPIYIILWILIPAAKTTVEKLEMKGKPINIVDIEKKIKAEFENVKQKIENANYSKLKSGFQDFLDFLMGVITGLFKIIGKVIGLLLVIFASIVLLVSVIGLFYISGLEMFEIDRSFMEYPFFFYDSIIPIWLLFVMSFATIVIPFLILFILGFRILSGGTKQFGKTVFLSLAIIWITVALTWVFVAVEYNSKRAISGIKINEEKKMFKTLDTLRLKIINNDYINYKHYFRQNNNHEVVYDKGIEKKYSNNVRIEIKQSETKFTHIKIRREAKGKNRNKAIKNAEGIEYSYTITDDNNLVLNGYFLSSIDNIHKDENVIVTTYIPVNNTIYFTKNIRNSLSNIYIAQSHTNKNVEERHFIMTKEGLVCTDCNQK